MAGLLFPARDTRQGLRGIDMAQYQNLTSSGILIWTLGPSKDENHLKREDKDKKDRNQDKRNSVNASDVRDKGTSGLIVGFQRTSYQKNHPESSSHSSSSRKSATIVRVRAISRVSASVNVVNDKGYTV